MDLLLVRSKHPPLHLQRTSLTNRNDFWNSDKSIISIGPHEGLDLATPASVYVPSPRELPKNLPSIEYGSDFVVRRVKNHGEFGWNNEHVFISTYLVEKSSGSCPSRKTFIRSGGGNTWLGDFDAWAMKFNPRKTLY